MNSKQRWWDAYNKNDNYFKQDKTWKWNDPDWHRHWDQQKPADQGKDAEKMTENKKEEEQETKEGSKEEQENKEGSKEPEKKKKWEAPAMQKSTTVWIGYFLPHVQSADIV